MPKVYFSLGTNLGDKKENLQQAVNIIHKRVGKVISLSAFYETEPWRFDSPNSFLNAAVCTDTVLTPLEVLKETQLIEKEMGRTIKTTDNTYSDRLIDIDILLYDDLVLHTEKLTIPHPLMTNRRFVMDPLVEIAPDLLHPVFLKRMKDLYNQ